ncbi:translation initiation factor IF-2-like [Gopherus flavomarginatus]|uniref:translation initiation factor IF-2-like n=1 Tax=Gopherus flavomarginatus TaxID=286002 RepID=UPI0021CBB235|nr:translation initiation factor IF-2-like [Gopherus flavomarginatus]
MGGRSQSTTPGPSPPAPEAIPTAALSEAPSGKGAREAPSGASTGRDPGGGAVSPSGAATASPAGTTNWESSGDKAGDSTSAPPFLLFRGASESEVCKETRAFRLPRFPCTKDQPSMASSGGWLTGVGSGGKGNGSGTRGGSGGTAETGEDSPWDEPSPTAGGSPATPSSTEVDREGGGGAASGAGQLGGPAMTGSAPCRGSGVPDAPPCWAKGQSLRTCPIARQR